LAARQPATVEDLLQVNGIGERKAELYGAEIFAVLDAYRKGARASTEKTAAESPANQTKRLLAEGKTFAEIAEMRGRQVSTVVNMVADLVEKGKLEYHVEWVGAEAHALIEEATRRLGAERLKPLKEELPPEITYEQIRLVVAFVRMSPVAG
jgi:ATP-dependent DNA helicase RecQ